jgi:hypothetical protein
MMLAVLRVTNTVVVVESDLSAEIAVGDHKLDAVILGSALDDILSGTGRE